MFILLALVFRNIRLATHSTEFFLAVDLWLTWLEPNKALAKMGWPDG